MANIGVDGFGVLRGEPSTLHPKPRDHGPSIMTEVSVPTRETWLVCLCGLRAYRISGLGFRVWGLWEFRVCGFRVEGVWSRVYGLRVYGLRVKGLWV